MNDTSQVLSDCLALFSSPAHEKYPSLARGLLNSHPDIQYFKDVKDKNHYEYHKLKNITANVSHNAQLRPSNVQIAILNVLGPPKLVQPAGSMEVGSEHARAGAPFNPHDRASLLNRLASFTVLNWKIPDLGLSQNDLNELTCAINGWRCPKTGAKNSLSCTYCHAVLQLKFNDSTSSNSDYFPFDFDGDDYMELNVALAQSYLKQIRSAGHETSCLWRIYETPLEGVYYPRPYIDETSVELVDEYLRNLKALTDNSGLVVELRPWFTSNSVNFTVGTSVDEFISKSNALLIDRYYKEDQENSYYDIQLNSSIPRWMYRIATKGWSLHVQYFSREYVILLVCSKCNSRVFLPQSQKQSPAELNFSPSRVLTPCNTQRIFRPTTSASTTRKKSSRRST